ncbi:MAG: dihydroorotase [Clostridia bacterium]|nr:dihydroorotase [Clostridia bacterium]
MKYLLKNANVFRNSAINKTDILIDNGTVVSVGIFPDNTDNGETVVFDLNNCFVFPGFIDVHVHLREPGFSYKETIATGSLAAAHGGYTDVCAMPNLKPVPDSAEHLKEELDIISRDAVINVHAYGAISVNEEGAQLADLEGIAKDVIAFSDDGRGVQRDELMLEAMTRAKKLDKIIAAHCEVNELLKGGYIHAGEYAKEHGHRGICSESEWKQIERDIELARRTGCRYHVCHVSTKESVELIRRAKASGVDITCETGPHYLVFSDKNLIEDGRFKMNPPLRSEEDKQALIEGILDGTIDMIATDHAPHSAEEKSRGLEKSLMGVVGLETAFAVLYTELVKKGILTLPQLVCLMSEKPGKRFGIDTQIREGSPANLCAWNLNKKYTIDPGTFHTKGRATPFAGMNVFGECVLTMVKGELTW